MLTLPSVAVLIPTYTRTRTLAEAVLSVIKQDYPGQIDVVVLNDQPRQTLKPPPWTPPNITVRVVNEKTVYPSLGAKRHAMLAMTTCTWVSFLDDDDLWMPWHLIKLTALPAPNVQAIFPTHQFLESLGTWSYGPVPGGINSVFVRTDLARRVGFDAALNVGEDNAFRNEIEKRAGAMWRPGSPSNVYRATAPVLHISRSLRGVVVDRSIFLDAATKLLDDKVEPEGDVVIEPMWCLDYVDLARRLFPEVVPTAFHRKRL